MVTIGRTLVAAIVLAVLGFAGSATNVFGSSGSVAPELGPSDPFAEVTVPTGPELLSNAPVRAGSALPSGNTLFLVIDSHRGDILGRGLPTPEGLQHAEAVSLALAASVHTISFHAVTGTIAGVLTVSGGPAHKVKKEREPTRAVIVKNRSRTIAVAHTNGKGAFSIRLAPGTYTLEGTVGSLCQGKTVVVRPDKTARVKLLCSVL